MWSQANINIGLNLSILYLIISLIYLISLREEHRQYYMFKFVRARNGFVSTSESHGGAHFGIVYAGNWQGGLWQGGLWPRQMHCHRYVDKHTYKCLCVCFYVYVYFLCIWQLIERHVVLYCIECSILLCFGNFVNNKLFP